MKRHVAATLAVVLAFGILDSHLDWEPLDQGHVLSVSGQRFDPQGWLAESWRQLRLDCAPVQAEPLNSETALAKLHAIEQHSLPDSLEAQLLQVQRQGPWAIAEVRFKTLNPSLVVLQWQDGHWRIQDTAIWSGSTAPWSPPDFVRRYLQQRAPDAPEALLGCTPIDAQRYAAQTVKGPA